MALFILIAVGGGREESVMGICIGKKKSKNGLIYPRPVFIARSHDQTLRS